MLAPKRLTHSRIVNWTYRKWITQCDRLFVRTEEIDLRRALSDGEQGFNPGRWAELTGNMQRTSLLLADSPHVKFLEQYLAWGETLAFGRKFEETAYFINAMECVKITGNYFGQSTVADIMAQARSFITLYERIKSGNSLEVNYPSTLAHYHSYSQTLPSVRKTWTQSTVQIEDGMHRFAIAWVLNHKKTRAVVFPARPTRLQSLVTFSSKSKKQRELYQPIKGVEFDSSWQLVRQCHDRLEKMLKFLSTSKHRVSELSVLDLGCSYGWFVAEFSKRGSQHAVGVDINPEVLKIGQIAYGLKADQLVKSDLQIFLNNCDRTYDVVLVLSTLHHLALESSFETVKRVLKHVDALTGTVLFMDTGQAHERGYRDSLSEWDNDFIIKLIEKHTSFDRVLPLGVDSDNVGTYSDKYRRTLFACVRE